MLGLSLDHGGHLTHGLKVNFSGKLYEFHHYGVSRETMMVDYDEVLAQAKEVRPKLIVCGGSAYPRAVEADRFREIADEVGAMLMTDMAHFAGLVAAGLHPSPVPHSHFVTSTTHKTLAGPARRLRPLHRGARAGARPRALPRDAGRAAHAHDRGEGDVLPDRGDRGVPRLPGPGAGERRRARRGLIDGGLDVLTGGTDTHLVQLDLRDTEWTGLAAQDRLDECRLTVNRNTVPFDERPPMVASGVRIGTPGGDDARLRRGRLPRGGLDHRRRALGRRRHRRARRRSRRSATAGRCIPGFRGYTTYVT